MSHDDAHTTHDTAAGVSRRKFIQGVVAGSVAVSSAAYLFRSSPLVSGQGRAGGVERLLTLTVNGQTRRVDVAPSPTAARCGVVRESVPPARRTTIGARWEAALPNPRDRGSSP